MTRRKRRPGEVGDFLGFTCNTFTSCLLDFYGSFVEQHRENIRKHNQKKEQTIPQSEQKSEVTDSLGEDGAFWERLNQLEAEEEEKNELDSDAVSGEDGSTSDDEEVDSSGKHVTWKDLETRQKKTIEFQHSPMESSQLQVNSEICIFSNKTLGACE